MTLSLEEVDHIAELAKLALTEAEKALYREQLSDILDYVRRLQAVDTQDVPPTFTVLPIDTVLRADATHPGFPREDLLINAEDTEDGMFRVEAVLD